VTRAGIRPSLREERRVLESGHALLAGVDEVGRGALGGPVSVGVVVIDAGVTRSLPGVRDSKLLTPGERATLVPRIRRWVVASAVGHASAAEVDDVGIIAALRRAGRRALAECGASPDVILLDGHHDWLSTPAQGDLLASEEPWSTPVLTRIKADLTCASVAAASVLAKVERDDLMVGLDARHPGYGWAGNKGYATPDHLDALRRLGPCEEHRRSWRLPGTDEEGEP
jgi:ribonuclease HII